MKKDLPHLPHPLPTLKTIETDTKNTYSLLPPPSSYLETNTPLEI